MAPLLFSEKFCAPVQIEGLIRYFRTFDRFAMKIGVLQIKRRMRKDKWNKERIIFWQAIYENLLARLKKTGFKMRTPSVKPDPFLAKVGREIRGWRKKKGLAQKELAERMKVNQQVISRLERGEDNVSVKYLRRLADALGADVSIILTPKQRLD